MTPEKRAVFYRCWSNLLGFFVRCLTNIWALVVMFVSDILKFFICHLQQNIRDRALCCKTRATSHSMKWSNQSKSMVSNKKWSLSLILNKKWSFVWLHFFFIFWQISYSLIHENYRSRFWQNCFSQKVDKIVFLVKILKKTNFK